MRQRILVAMVLNRASVQEFATARNDENRTVCDTIEDGSGVSTVAKVFISKLLDAPLMPD